LDGFRLKYPKFRFTHRQLLLVTAVDVVATLTSVTTNEQKLEHLFYKYIFVVLEIITLMEPLEECSWCRSSQNFTLMSGRIEDCR
jgi:hypothetical protein